MGPDLGPLLHHHHGGFRRDLLEAARRRGPGWTGPDHAHVEFHGLTGRQLLCEIPTAHHPTGALVGCGRASGDTLPPCGGGLGWGVVPRGTEVPQRTTPTPNPSPQGGGEEFAAPLRPNFPFSVLA